MRSPLISAVDGYALAAATSCRWRAPIASLGARRDRSAGDQPARDPRFRRHADAPAAGRAAGAGARRRQLFTAAGRGADRRSSTADAVTAAQAHALGLVDEVAPADALAHALDVARRVALGEFGHPLVAAHAHLHARLSQRRARPRDPARAGPSRACAARRGSAGHRRRRAPGSHQGDRGRAGRGGARLRPARGLRGWSGGIDRFLARRSLPLPLRPRG